MKAIGLLDSLLHELSFDTKHVVLGFLLKFITTFFRFLGSHLGNPPPCPCVPQNVYNQDKI